MPQMPRDPQLTLLAPTARMGPIGIPQRAKGKIY